MSPVNWLSRELRNMKWLEYFVGIKHYWSYGYFHYKIQYRKVFLCHLTCLLTNSGIKTGGSNISSLVRSFYSLDLLSVLECIFVKANLLVFAQVTCLCLCSFEKYLNVREDVKFYVFLGLCSMTLILLNSVIFTH